MSKGEVSKAMGRGSKVLHTQGFNRQVRAKGEATPLLLTLGS